MFIFPVVIVNVFIISVVLKFILAFCPNIKDLSCSGIHFIFIFFITRNKLDFVFQKAISIIVITISIRRSLPTSSLSNG